MTVYNLLRIDELIIGEYTYINPFDECYYLLEYTAGAGFLHSTTNQLIINFKKPVDRRGKPEYRYKEQAIDQIADILKKAVIPAIDLTQSTLVPIPPSKQIGHELYDNRMMEVLRKSTIGSVADVRELLFFKNSMQASHECGSRPTIAEIQENLGLSSVVRNDLKKYIILFDDVLTTGAHYVACKNFLLEKFPGKNVFGIFIARRAK